MMHDLRSLGYRKAACHFCHRTIPDRTMIGGNVANQDDIGCAICRVPVCDSCGKSTWSGNEDVTTYCERFRFCARCADNPAVGIFLRPGDESWTREEIAKHEAVLGLMKNGNRRGLSKPEYCALCDRIGRSGIVRCPSCNAMVCPECLRPARQVGGQSLCIECLKNSEARKYLCNACGKEIHPTERSVGGKPCPGCGKTTCPSCLSQLGSVKGKTTLVCPPCVSRFPPPSYLKK